VRKLWRIKGIEEGVFGEVAAWERRSNGGASFTEQSSMVLLSCQWVSNGIHSNGGVRNRAKRGKWLHFADMGRSNAAPVHERE
jgi:hypothetical protein